MRRTFVRGFFVIVLLFSASSLALSYASSTTEKIETELREQKALPYEERTPITGARDGVTVVTTSPRKTSVGEIIAFAPDGRLLYYNNTYKKYFDVDPSQAGKTTVIYGAAKILPPERCGAVDDTRDCILNVIERVNLTTGETTRLFSRVTDGLWHDVDRLNESRYLVGDIVTDRVYIINISSGTIEWGWNPKTRYPIRSGGVYPSDWTHLNDVERLDDGRIMVSLRNQDSVVFIDRERGLIKNWTLGTDDNHSILYEQHNPDYIPEERGGPAVVVADSENNRVVEYQRIGGEWQQTWMWRDARMRWPRDADRLPNGHTLITDSNGNRIIEVNQSGAIVWQVSVDTPYEAERLGTGDESTGGESATKLNLTSRGQGIENTRESGEANSGFQLRSVLLGLWVGIQEAVPSLVLNGILFVLPSWMGVIDLIPVVTFAGGVFVWGIIEAWWAGYRLRSPVIREEI